MRRLLVILAAVGALAAPLGAQAGTTVEKQTFDDTFPLCNGDPIHVSGTLVAVISDTTTPSGGEMLAFHFQPQGVTGVDLVTGTVFHATGLTRDLIVNSPAGGSTETFVNRFHIQATRAPRVTSSASCFTSPSLPPARSRSSSTTSRPPADATGSLRTDRRGRATQEGRLKAAPQHGAQDKRAGCPPVAPVSVPWSQSSAVMQSPLSRTRNDRRSPHFALASTAARAPRATASLR